MKSIMISANEAENLISWKRAENILVGPLSDLYFWASFSGCFVCRKTFTIYRKNMNCILLFLTVAGEGLLRYKGKEYCLSPGSIALIDARNLHEFRAVEDGWTFKYIHFRGAMSAEYQSHIENQYGPVFLLSRKSRAETEERLESVYQELAKSGMPDHAELSATIYTILVSFLLMKNAVDSGQKSAEVIQRAVTYITENYRRNITTQEIADAVFLSRGHMSELFTKTYGMAPHEYLTMYRLSHVRYGLVNTTLPVSVLAEQNGFRDVFALSRVFKKKFGMSPTEYRKSVQE